MAPNRRHEVRRREVLAWAGAAALAPACARGGQPAPLPARSPGLVPDPARLPYWRGFNLLDKFIYGKDGPYQEWDFDFLAEHGFNFVRLPTDYRCWTEAPGKYREAPLAEIAQAVEWARSRGVHVNLALHRAPGYSVNRKPPEALDLWGEGAGSERARRQFLEQWRLLADRLDGFSSAELSFNLLNEPADVTGAAYRKLVEPVVAAIRERSPERLIVADGIDYGKKPVPELTPLRLAQSTRGYAPFRLTHYRADWVEGADRWSTPIWPVDVLLNQYLFGTQKPELQSALVLRGEFPAGAELSIHVLQVSQRARLVISADGEPALERLVEPGAGAGEWKSSEYRAEWNIYQALYDRAYSGKLTRACRELRVELTDGDWLTFSKLSVGALRVAPNEAEWGKRQRTFDVDARGELQSQDASNRVDRERLFLETVEPWRAFSVEHATGVHVGEWGAHQHTPHAVVLTWMGDCLANWRRAELGWALWNLRGSFGCVDSGRRDVRYEAYRGKMLDRGMLELLKANGAIA